MYIIGDAACTAKVEMWNQVTSILEGRNQIGRILRLRCPRHIEAVLEISTPSDFEIVAPEGGCKELCRQQRKCGHSCDLLCHAEIRHESAPCQKPCPKSHPCGHSCSKRCSESCGKCMVLENDVRLPCGHSLPSVECWVARDLTKPETRCRERVVRELPRCGHKVEMWCWDNP